MQKGGPHPYNSITMLWMMMAGSYPLHFKTLRPTAVMKIRRAMLRKSNLLDAMGFVLPLRKHVNQRQAESGPQEADLKGTLEGPVTIYDPSGRIVWTGILKGHLPPLKGGIYFLRSGSQVRKVVVR